MKKFMVIAKMVDGTTYCNTFDTLEKAQADRNAVLAFYNFRVASITIA